MTTEPIQKFLLRVRTAQQSRSKDVRLSMEEAQELVSSIGELLVLNVDKLKSAVSQAHSEEITEVKVDGGGF